VYKIKAGKEHFLNYVKGVPSTQMLLVTFRNNRNVWLCCTWEINFRVVTFKTEAVAMKSCL